MNVSKHHYDCSRNSFLMYICRLAYPCYSCNASIYPYREMKPTATLGGGQMKVTVFMIIVGIIFLCIFVGLLTLIVRALLKYIHSKDVRQEKSVVRKSLGEALKVHRTQCKMTQEFVAETIGVSRQAVSKWENGTSDPSTSNLFALAKLYGISVEELLKEVE